MPMTEEEWTLPERGDVDPLGWLAIAALIAAAAILLMEGHRVVRTEAGVPFLLLLLAVLAIQSFTEWRWGIIPDVLTLPGFLLALVLRGILDLGVIGGLAGAFIAPFVLAFINNWYRERRGVDGIGPGPRKLMLMVGAFLGPKGGLLVLLLAWGLALLNLAFLAIAGHRAKGIEFGPPVGAAVALVIVGAWRGWLGALV
jgi:prepilin signal peptidase PulO-like enzyme (type II secretory pathway)